MTNQDMYAAILGTVMPAIIAFVNQRRWPNWVRGLVALGLSIITGFLASYFRGNVFGGDWVRTALVVATAAVVSYHVWWKPSTIAPAIEVATSIA